MKYYFYSPFSSKLCSGLEYLCDLSKNITTTECQNPFFSIFSGENYMPSYLINDYAINGKLYNFYYGKLFIPSLTETMKPYKLIDEKTVAINGTEVYAKLYIDGTRKLDILILNRRFTTSVPIEATKLDIINCGNSILFELSGNIKHIVLFSALSFKIIFSCTCVSYEIKDTLTITKAYIGTTKFLSNEHYKVTDNVTLLGKNVIMDSNINFDIPIIKKLHFLQLVKLYGDYQHFLSPNIFDKAETIKDFIGDFLYLIPPIEDDFPSTIAAIYPDKVKYIDITLDNGLIEDISIENAPIQN